MSKNNRFEIKVNRDGWAFGIVLILVAVLIVLEGLGMGFGAFGVSLWKAGLGVILLAWILKDLFRLKIANIFFPLAFEFMLFEENIAHLLGRTDENIISNWYVLLAALLLTIGCGTVFKSAGGARVSVESDINTDGNIESSFSGNSVSYIDAAELTRKSVSNNFGRSVVYIENKEAYMGNGVIAVDNNFGSMEIHAPAEWNVRVSTENSFGSIVNSTHWNSEGPRLDITGNNDFGSLKIVAD